jgi:predicted nuclease of predicted toxin-antitoxin system
MNILIDECLPVSLRHHLPGHNVESVEYRGWKGIRNGRLLPMATAAGFECFVTTDLGMVHSQNAKSLPIQVYVLHVKSNALPGVLPSVPALLDLLANAPTTTGFFHVRA